MTAIVRLIFAALIIWGCGTPIAWANTKLSQEEAAAAFSSPPDLVNARLAYDGKHIALVKSSRESSFIEIHEVRVKPDGTPALGSARPEVVDFGGGIESVRWIDSNWLIIKVRFQQQAKGKPRTFHRIATVDSNGANRRFLGRGTRGQISANLGTDVLIDTLPNDPEHVLIQSTRSLESKSPSAIRVNVRTGEHETVQSRRSNVAHWFTDIDGVPRLGLGFGDKRKFLFHKAQGSNSFRRITIPQRENSPFFSPITLSRNANELYAITTHATDNFSLYTYDISAQKFKERVYAHPNYDVTGALISAKSREVVGAAYVDDLPRRHFLDPHRKALEEKVRTQFNTAVVRVDSSDEQFRHAVVFTRGRWDPGTFYLVNLQNGKKASLGNVFRAFNYGALAPMKSIEYEARDGEHIKGYLTGFDLETARNQPLVVLLHGGPFYRDVQQYNPFTQFLASRGYAVLQINYRGSTGYGWKFRKLSYKQWGLAIQQDVEDGLDWAVEKGIADPDRVCIAGASYGGYEALVSAYKMPDKIKCAVSLNGVADLFRMLRDRKKELDFAMDDVIVGDPVTDRARLEATSPSFNAEKIDVPILLVHSSSDEIVSRLHSTDMARSLRRLDKPVDLVLLPGADHSLSVPDHRKKYFIELGDFLAEHLSEASG